MKLQDFFYFQKSDRRMLIALLALTAVGAGIIYYVGGNNGRTAVAEPDTVMRADIEKGRFHREPVVRYNTESRREELFVFDPNTADSTQLLRLGLQPWQVRSIYRYRAKGGVYRRPRDFARLYGLTVRQYRRLEPYIRISPDFRPAAELFKDDRRPVRDTSLYPVKLQGEERVILNTADTNMLKRVPGIGSYFARQIVRYGRLLGGYVRIEQLSEIEGFPMESMKYFAVEHPQTQRMNVNKLTLNQLQRHPYLNFFQSKAIVDYRRLRGPLKSLHDLKLSKDFPPEAIERLAPYVEF